MSRLFIRVQTQSGSRTIITQDLTARDAIEITYALRDAGLTAMTVTDATPVDMKAVLKRRDRVRAKPIPKPLPSNVTPIRKKKP